MESLRGSAFEDIGIQNGAGDAGGLGVALAIARYLEQPSPARNKLAVQSK